MAGFAFLPYGTTQTKLSLGYVDYIQSVQNYTRSHLIHENIHIYS